MKRAYSLWLLLRAAYLPALGLTVIAFFGGYALLGANGVLAWGKYTHALERRQRDLITVQRQRAQLANQVALLDPRHANLDLVDQLVRQNLGVADKDEVILPLKAE